MGCVFEAVEYECEVLPADHNVSYARAFCGHMAVSVKTSAGNICVVGDAIFVERNLEPNPAEKWRHWVPARFVNSYEGWKSVEEIDKCADYVLASEVFPYEGVPIRNRRQHILGYKFYFGDMPVGTVDLAALALSLEEVAEYEASLVNPKDTAEY